jgi:hypothetical protein
LPTTIVRSGMGHDCLVHGDIAKVEWLVTVIVSPVGVWRYNCSQIVGVDYDKAIVNVIGKW